MSNWLARGLRRGILTTHYPLRPDAMPPAYRGRPEVLSTAGGDDAQRGAASCLSGAIRVPADGAPIVVMERCFQCGECARSAPDAFAMRSDHELALAGDDPDAAVERLRERAASFGRSVHLRHVDCGSDASTEQELQAIFNPFYDVNRLGIFMTATPRHADLLVVTGVVTHAMVEPLRRAYDAMPEPKVVVALGSDACSGTIYAEASVAGTVDSVIPVDVKVPGTPPAPLTIIHALWVALGRRAAPARTQVS